MHSSRAVWIFLSTPSARRATLSQWLNQNNNSDFYPRPPRGGRRQLSRLCVALLLFLSTPSARRATVDRHTSGCFVHISIHALREEGDGTL